MYDFNRPVALWQSELCVTSTDQQHYDFIRQSELCVTSTNQQHYDFIRQPELCMASTNQQHYDFIRQAELCMTSTDQQHYDFIPTFCQSSSTFGHFNKSSSNPHHFNTIQGFMNPIQAFGLRIAKTYLRTLELTRAMQNFKNICDKINEV